MHLKVAQVSILVSLMATSTSLQFSIKSMRTSAVVLSDMVKLTSVVLPWSRRLTINTSLKMISVKRRRRVLERKSFKTSLLVPTVEAAPRRSRSLVSTNRTTGGQISQSLET